MKIVNRVQFMAMPAGVVFSKFEPFIFGDLQIKGDTIGADFYGQDVASGIRWGDTNEFIDSLQAAVDTGGSLAMDLHCEVRDGLFDEDQLFAVWERPDVEALIARLAETLA